MVGGFVSICCDGQPECTLLGLHALSAIEEQALEQIFLSCRPLFTTHSRSLSDDPRGVLSRVGR